MRFLLVSMAVFTFTACATTGYQVEQGVDSATVTFKKGDFDSLGLGKSASKQYNTPAIVRGCDVPKLLANFIWTGPDSKTKEVEAGKAMTIGAVITGHTVRHTAQSGVNEIITEHKQTCSSRVTFTPVAGESYSINLVESASGACSIDLANVKTGNTPDTAVIEDQYNCLTPSTN